MKSFFILLLIFINAKAFAANDTLVPFKTDYCTGVPEGVPRDPSAWKECCLVHDMNFWAGGDKSDRDAADVELRECVAAKGYPVIARIIYEGVRLGSYSPIKFEDKKWNFGWKDRTEFQKLTAVDIDQIEKELDSSEYAFIPLHIKIAFIYELRNRK